MGNPPVGPIGGMMPPQPGIPQQQGMRPPMPPHGIPLFYVLNDEIIIMHLQEI